MHHKCSLLLKADIAHVVTSMFLDRMFGSLQVKECKWSFLTNASHCAVFPRGHNPFISSLNIMLEWTLVSIVTGKKVTENILCPWERNYMCVSLVQIPSQSKWCNRYSFGLCTH